MKTTAGLAWTILLMQGFLWIQTSARASEPTGTRQHWRLAMSQEATQEVERVASAANPTLPEGLTSALGERRGEERVPEQRIASVLQKLGKTLVLEGTRGAKEMELYQRAAPAVVLVVTNEGFGSGALIDNVGHIITNWHVVSTYPQVVVVLKPRDSAELKKELAFRATVEKADQVTDLALLKIQGPPKALSSLPLGNVSTLAIGQDVHAIGHPEGEVWTYTKGIISQIRANYTWTTTDARSHQAKVIQTQTPVNPGNSGGPLLDDNGRLIGINSFRRQGEGLNYAVAVDEIQAFLQREGSRESRVSHPQAEPRCMETYNTKGQGGNTIQGCYISSKAPPPDLWLVHRNPNQPAAYGAFAGVVAGQLNTVVKSKDPQWERLEFYIDSQCTGTVDLIGQKSKGSGTIDSYRAPEKPMRLVTLAKELDSALKQGKIPYPQLRVCQ